MKGEPAQLTYQDNVVNKALEYIGDFSPLWAVVLLVPHALIAYLVFTDSGSPLVIYWFGGLVVYFFASLSIRRRISYFSPGKHKTTAALLIFFLDGLALASLVWFAPGLSSEVHFLMAASLAMLLLAGITTSTGLMSLMVSYSAPIVSAIGYIVYLGYSADLSQTYWIVGAIGLCATLIVLGISRDVFSVFSDSHISNLHNLNVNNRLKENVLASQSANDSKMRFLASASHDLRQPINALSMSIATLKLKKPADCDRIITRMDTAIESINSQLLGLLDISKLDAGIVELKPSPVNLVEHLKAIVDTSQQERDRIVPILYVGPDEQITCHTDPVWLERIVRNLVTNAIKYTNKGKIIIKLEQLPKHEARITIADTGIGIAKDDLGRVFDEFVQIDNPERDERKGLGLGLAIVKRTCALLDFRIQLASVLGRGTSISIVVPTVKSLPFRAKPALSEGATMTSLNVLALDNDPANLEGMTELLEQLGHKVYAFEAFRTAELCVAGTHIDIAFVDYRMPGDVQGVEAIRRFQQHNPRLKCYLVTGDGNIREDLQDIEVIHKPVTMAKFLSAFR